MDPFLINPNTRMGRNAFDDNNVIPPPQHSEPLEEDKTLKLVIDSRTRNFKEHSDANKYIIDLPEEYRDIKALSLTSYDVPLSQYNILQTSLHYGWMTPAVTTEGADVVVVDYKKENKESIQINKGIYSEETREHDVFTDYQTDDLAENLETALNLTGASYWITIKTRTDKYTICTDFGNATTPDIYTDPTFFIPFFQGDDALYEGREITQVRKTLPSGEITIEEVDTSRMNNTYLDDSLGEKLGFDRTDPDTMGNGLVESTAPGTLTGTGTSFTTQLEEGDWVFTLPTDGSAATRLRIETITSDTECVLADEFLLTAIPTISESYFWIGRIEAPGRRNLRPEPYTILNIRGGSILDSTNEVVHKSFHIIPWHSPHWEYTGGEEYGIPMKRYHPVQGRLLKMEITFLNPDGSLYDFQGSEHVLVFAIQSYKQNISYSDHR
jgi:hypothetical protein